MISIKWCFDKVLRREDTAGNNAAMQYAEYFVLVVTLNARNNGETKASFITQSVTFLIRSFFHSTINDPESLILLNVMPPPHQFPILFSNLFIAEPGLMKVCRMRTRIASLYLVPGRGFSTISSVKRAFTPLHHSLFFLACNTNLHSHV